VLIAVGLGECRAGAQPEKRYPAPTGESAQSWFAAGQHSLKQAEDRTINTRKANNIIVFLGDGMGISTVTAARIFAGQRRGESGEENLLSFERFPWTGLVKTYATNETTPDSAATMSAIMTGVKTRSGELSVAPESLRNDPAGAVGRKLPTMLEICELLGKSTGVVSTTRLTHATPAACYAHTPERNWEDDRAMSRLSPAALEAGYPDIARQLIEFPVGDGLEVALGGGRRSFLPATAQDPEQPRVHGARFDGRDLVAAWKNHGERWTAVVDEEGFQAVNPVSTDHLLGLFEPSHMRFEIDRERDVAGEPSLTEMTKKALAILSRNDQGFFLMVEGGRIDHAHHVGNAYRALSETVEFGNAIEAAVAFLKERSELDETLIIVTADHSHVMTIAGYPTRGNDILGKVVSNDSAGEPANILARDANGLPYTTVSYANGPGYRRSGETNTKATRNNGDQRANARPDLTNIDTTAPSFVQEAAVPTRGETHGGEDVGVWAMGPQAHLLAHAIEQNEIFHVMARALGLEGESLLRVWSQVKAIIDTTDKTEIGASS